MNAAEARALLFQRKLRELPLEISLPDLSALDHQLSMLELRGTDTTHAQKLAKGEDGEVDNVLATAAMICKSLILRESKERIFTDTDIEGVAGFGASLLKVLEDKVVEVSGLSQQAVEQARKDFLPTPENASNSSSAANSVEAPTPSGVNA